MIFLSLIKELKSFFRLFLFQNKTEKYIYFGLLLIYLPLALVVIFQTSIVDNPNVEADMYFSYDNGMILRHGHTRLAAHPLIVFFYYPFVVLGNLLAIVLGMKAKTILFVFLTSSLISMSAVYVYRYLKQIVALGHRPSIGLTIMYACFGTNLVLSFTPESFTLSAFLLSFGVYFFSWSIKENRPPSYFISLLFGWIILGGVTITNVAKGIVPLFFQKEKLWKRLLKMTLIGGATIIMLISFHLVLNTFFNKDFFSELVNHKNHFIVPYQGSWEYVELYFSRMWGATILLPEMVKHEYYNSWMKFDELMVREGDYTYLWQYAYVAILFVLSLFSIFRNITNRYVLLLAALASVDIFIHVVMKFGVAWLFMYGGHWVYLIPLILGWLYKDVDKIKSEKVIRGIHIFGIMIIVVLIVNNTLRMVEFVELAAKLYPPVE